MAAGNDFARVKNDLPPTTRGRIGARMFVSALDLPTLGTLISVGMRQNPKEDLMHFHIENMTCGGCVRSVTRAIQSVDSAAQVSADPATRKVDIVTTAPREQLQSVLAAAGFAVN